MDREQIVIPSTGRVLDPCCGVIGIGPDGMLYEGYDGFLSGSCGLDDTTTNAEVEELCMMVVSRWRRLYLQLLSLDPNAPFDLHLGFGEKAK
jgi:hypothetical protein